MVECFDGALEPVDFETLFKLRVSDKLKKVLAEDDSLPTQFVLVPSLGDAFHDFVFPQVRCGATLPRASSRRARNHTRVILRSGCLAAPVPVAVLGRWFRCLLSAWEARATALTRTRQSTFIGSSLPLHSRHRP